MDTTLGSGLGSGIPLSTKSAGFRSVNFHSKQLHGARPVPLPNTTENTEKYGMISVAIHAFKEYGALRFTKRAFKFTWRSIRLRWWDYKHNVDTCNRILAVKDISGPSAAHALYYEACDSRLQTRLLRNLGIDFKDFIFIDIGTGKGKPLLVSAEFPFKRIIGLELSPALSEAARENCRNFRSSRQLCNNVEVICGDALEFEFPKEPTVLFMYNPFDALIMEPVIGSLVRSIKESPRKVVIIYLNPRQAHVIDRFEEFVPVLHGRDEADYRGLHYKVYSHV